MKITDNRGRKSGDPDNETMKEQEENKLIGRYVSGICDYRDILNLYDILEKGGDGGRELSLILEYLEGRKVELPSDSDRSFMKCLMKINRPKKRRSFGMWAMGAATAVLTVILTLSLTGIIGGKDTVIRYVSGNAISRIELPDGTKVTMAKGSRIDCPEKFGSGQRRVSLDGEAFFDVAHDDTAPFYVDATDVSIMVTGTKFDAVNDMGNGIVSTTLVEGSVRFINGSGFTDVLPGEQLTYNRETGALTRGKADVSKAVLWTEDIHRYRSVTLSTLAGDFSAIFGCTIILDPSLKDIVISGTFRNDDSITDVLEILESCLDIEYKFGENAVFIRKRTAAE